MSKNTAVTAPAIKEKKGINIESAGSWIAFVIAIFGCGAAWRSTTKDLEFLRKEFDATKVQVDLLKPDNLMYRINVLSDSVRNIYISDELIGTRAKNYKKTSNNE